MPDSDLPVVLTAEDSTLEPGDWQWGDEIRRLRSRLRSYDLEVQQRFVPGVEAEKGVVTDIILALGSSGMVSAAAAVLHSWLNGRSTRRVTLTIGDGPNKRTLQLVGEGMSERSMRAALLAALGHPETEADGASPEPLPPADEE